MDYCRQLRENVRVSLWGVRVMTHRDFDQCQPNGPHIRGDGVSSDVVLRLSFDAFRLRWFTSLVTGDVRDDSNNPPPYSSDSRC